MFTRSLLKLGKGASATLVESYIAASGAKTYQVHDSLSLSIGDDARLDHVRLVEDGREAFNISSSVVTLGAHAHFNTFGMTSGGSVSRYQAIIAVAGEHSRVETNGVNLLNGRQHADTTLFLDHAVPNCASREIFRAVVDDRGAFGVPGPHHRAAQGAEDRRQDDDAGAAVVRRGRGRQQAGTRNLRRRRHLRPWRHDRRARREPAVLSARARSFRKGSAGAADPGVCRRGDRDRSPTTICANWRSRPRSAGWRRGHDHASRRLQRFLRCGAGAARIFRRCRSRSMARSWSISTTPPPRKSRMRCSTA